MSERFGLAWKQEPYDRMMDFITIMVEQKKIKEEQDKKSKKQQSKFRPRLK